MRKVWIEAALNGAWSRALQPGIPDTIETIVAEGVACARAGATIVHVHAIVRGVGGANTGMGGATCPPPLARAKAEAIPIIQVIRDKLIGIEFRDSRRKPP